MFGIGLAISVPSIAVAFAVDDIRTSVRKAFKRLGGRNKRGTALRVQEDEGSERKKRDEGVKTIDKGMTNDALPMGKRNGECQETSTKRRHLPFTESRDDAAESIVVARPVRDLEKG